LVCQECLVPGHRTLGGSSEHYLRFLGAFRVPSVGQRLLRSANLKLCGCITGFPGTPFGLDILTAGLILAIMIIPTISSISKDVMMAVPSSQREAAYSLGATRWEVVRTGVLGYARSGIFGAIILGLGRAVGETMAVTMVIGNASGPAALPTSLFKQGATMASVIANEFSEAEPGSLHLSALIGIGLRSFCCARDQCFRSIDGLESIESSRRVCRVVLSNQSFRKFKDSLPIALVVFASYLPCCRWRVFSLKLSEKVCPQLASAFLQSRLAT